MFIWPSVLWKSKKHSYRPNYTNIFLLYLKGSNSQIFTSGNCKNVSPSMYFIDTTCFYKCYLSHVKTRRHCFKKIFLLPWASFDPKFYCFVWSKWFERNQYFIFYIHNNSTMLIQKFKIWSGRTLYVISYVLNLLNYFYLSILHIIL